MRHRLEWFIHQSVQGLSKGNDHPTDTPEGVWWGYRGGYFYFFIPHQQTQDLRLSFVVLRAVETKRTVFFDD